MTRQLNQRDERGWRIPESGTRSREIYNLSVDGLSPPQIAEALNMRVLNVRVLKHRFMHPDRTNGWRKK